MRIVALLHAYVPAHGAGAEHHAHTLLRALAARGHDVSVALTQPGVWQGDTSWIVDGVTVDGDLDKKRITGMARGADVLVTHLESTARAHALGSWLNVPVVDLLHNTFRQTHKWLTRDRCDLAVVNSEWMAANYADEPVPTALLRPLTKVADYATEPGDRVTMVNFHGNKGPHVFWELARRMPKTKFLAVRGGYGDQEIPKRTPKNVTVIGNTDNVRDDVLARTRILLMPSEYESWGRIGMEAMCAGIPVIASPTPGLLESLGDAGTFVDRDDVDGWCKAVARLSAAKAWGKASREASRRAAWVERFAAADLDRVATRIERLQLPARRTAHA